MRATGIFAGSVTSPRPASPRGAFTGAPYALRAVPPSGNSPTWGSCLAAALRVEVLAHDEQVADLPAEHALERRAPTEQRRRIGLAQPLAGAARDRKEDLQSRIDAEQVREPLELV